MLIAVELQADAGDAGRELEAYGLLTHSLMALFRRPLGGRDSAALTAINLTMLRFDDGRHERGRRRSTRRGTPDHNAQPGGSRKQCAIIRTSDHQNQWHRRKGWMERFSPRSGRNSEEKAFFVAEATFGWADIDRTAEFRYASYWPAEPAPRGLRPSNRRTRTAWNAPGVLERAWCRPHLAAQ